jgi:uncharacterized membrane protein
LFCDTCLGATFATEYCKTYRCRAGVRRLIRLDGKRNAPRRAPSATKTDYKMQPYRDRGGLGPIRAIMLGVMAVFYLAAGVTHVLAPDGFLAITPDWVPFPRQIVLVTGLCEIAGSIALMTRRLRYLAGVMLAIYAVCVFPANIKQAIEGINVPPLPNSWWYHGPRLAMQPVLVWWALFCSGVIDWPFAANRNQARAP